MIASSTIFFIDSFDISSHSQRQCYKTQYKQPKKYQIYISSDNFTAQYYPRLTDIYGDGNDSFLLLFEICPRNRIYVLFPPATYCSYIGNVFLL